MSDILMFSLTKGKKKFKCVKRDSSQKGNIFNIFYGILVGQIDIFLVSQ